ncbi:MAG: PIN domain-containing protein [Chitinophagaceae bacterium]|nr:PIN domain-containing protein [Chitinophagaceae bacterium]
MSYLLDTNILIGYYTENLPESIMEFVERVIKNSFNISFVNRLEVLGYPQLTKEQIADLETSFLNADEFWVDDIIISKAILVSRAYNLRAADAIIAATAIVNGLHLVTNDADFNRAHRELTVINPFIQIPPLIVE